LKIRKINPIKSLSGSIEVPGDKSISHRAVMLGSIADGTTEVTNFLEGDDNLHTAGAFRAMGVKIESPSKSRLIVHGVGLNGLKAPSGVIDAGNSGTTARLLTGILAAQSFTSVIDGDDSLRKRPMKRVIEPLRMMGADISALDDKLLPMTVKGKALKGIAYKSKIASAQVKSSILLAGLFAEGETSVEEPAKSRDHTERMFKKFGVDIRVDGNKATVKRAASLKAADIKVPGDISSAAFFIVGAMITPGSELLIKNVGLNPTRRGIIDILLKMNGAIEVVNMNDDDEPTGDLLVRTSKLNGVDINGDELLPAIDEFPIINIAAAFAEGSTKITGAEELRVKESDRITVMKESLTAIGVDAEELKDGIVIKGSGGATVRGGKIHSRGDHRIAMAFAIAALNSKDGIDIEDPACVDVSFPSFFEILKEASA